MRLTLYLLQPGVTASRDLLARNEDYREVRVRPPSNPDLAWQLYVKAPPPLDSRWVPTLRQIAQEPSDLKLQSQASGAILLCTMDSRVFALTFGTGFHAVSSSITEPDFGLKVAANSVDTKRLNMAEVRGMGKGARNAVSKLPIPNQLFALRLQPNEEWIRRLGGDCIDTTIATSINGAESLRITRDDFKLDGLATLLPQLLQRFDSDAYKEHLPTLDNFRRLPGTHPLIPQLNEAVDALVHRRDDGVGFAAPDELDFHDLDGYVLKQRRRPHSLTDLSTDAVYHAIDVLDGWPDPLHKIRVEALSGSSGPEKKLREYVVTDVSLPSNADAEHRYVCTANAWFKVAESYATYLAQVLDRVPDVTDEVAMPDWNDDWLKANVVGNYGEERYNRHAAARPGNYLVDRKLYTASAGERVEACDVITNRKQLVCVKRLDGSATMIHLFEQGAISATLLKQKDDYRDYVMKLYREAGGGGDFGSESDWTFVFAIATRRPGTIKELLPFFARASLNANIDTITDKGYRVALAKIEMT